MPQDKRLLITKAVVHKVQRVCGDNVPPDSVAVELAFIIPAIILQRDPSITTKLFSLSHPVYPKNGRSTVLIVPKVIALDCSKINKRHGYFDAVVAAEAICRRGDEDSEKRAVQVARTFSNFVVDARIVAKLPRCIPDACVASPAAGTSSGATDVQQGGPVVPRKYITPLSGLEERESLANRMATMAKGSVIRAASHGQCFLRVGHGGMTAGDISENAKNAIYELKQDYPSMWKFLEEFQLTTSVTTSIRYMEVGVHK